jgi:hypothetical protein
MRDISLYLGAHIKLGDSRLNVRTYTYSLSPPGKCSCPFLKSPWTLGMFSTLIPNPMPSALLVPIFNFWNTYMPPLPRIHGLDHARRYLLSAAGNFDIQVDLDKKEGPIHDFAWSPNSKEFGVMYGCKVV